MSRQVGLKTEFTRSSRGGLLTLAAIATITTVASWAQPSLALAQAEPEPAPPPAEAGAAGEPATLANPAAPAPAPDERPLPPPPPRAANTTGGTGYNPSASYSAPRTVYQPPASSNLFRPFSFSVGLGPGGLMLRTSEGKSSAGGATYSLRFGFGVQPRTSITLGWEGSSAQKGGYSYSQDALLLGVQHFVSQIVYFRAGMGIATETDDDNPAEILYSQEGFAFQGALGVDLLQTPSISLALEGGLLVGTYPDYGETWSTAGVNLVFSLY